MPTKIYYRTPRTFLDVIEKLTPKDVEAVWVDASKPLDEQAEALKDAAAIFSIPSQFPLELARKIPKLRLVQVFSAGTEHIDIAALGELGVKVANNNGGNAPAVAEHTVALMVSVYRKLNAQFEAARDGKWAGNFLPDWFSKTFELTDKTVGIVGLGRIGKQVAKRLKGWDCALIYHDIADIPRDVERGLNIKKASLDELLKTSDVVSLHVPLTRRSHHLIGKRELGLMKPTAVLISTCRGPVVDEQALIEALNEGVIAAAGLDVLDQEPPSPDNPLLHMDNVVVSPHLAGMSQEAQHRNIRFAIQNVI
ncbi:MAG: 2-hydroxyacid dehydrogenase, partial [Chloroflexi bacterium]|nr:2-hydroxyacid dehydrogenase [Chloroflexota bacterium]